MNKLSFQLGSHISQKAHNIKIIEILNQLLCNSKTKYIRDLFETETLFLDSQTSFISLVHHIYRTVSYATCKRVASHINKLFICYDGYIYVGAYSFNFSIKDKR